MMKVAAPLKELARGLDLDELAVVVTWTYDPAPHHRSYELLAQTFALGEAEPNPRNRYSLIATQEYCGFNEAEKFDLVLPMVDPGDEPFV